MKNVLVILLITLVTFKGFAQEDTSNIDQRVITTGVPFMLIAEMQDLLVWEILVLQVHQMLFLNNGIQQNLLFQKTSKE